MYLSLVKSQIAKIKRNFYKHLNIRSSNNLPVKKGGSHWHQTPENVQKSEKKTWIHEVREGLDISCCHWWGSREFQYVKNIRGALENYRRVPGTKANPFINNRILWHNRPYTDSWVPSRAAVTGPAPSWGGCKRVRASGGAWSARGMFSAQNSLTLRKAKPLVNK